MNPIRKPDWFLFAGIFFLLWAGINTYYDVSRYGAGWGLYWWFCNLATFGIGFGLVIRSRGLLTGFIAIASFTQIFWIIDNAYRIVTGEELFGLVGSMYQPGLPMDEFISSHYHYFTIPVSAIALFYLPITKKNTTLIWISVLNPFIFGVSYFLFPPYQNINCIHAACFKGLTLTGPLYSFGFWFVIFCMHLVIGRLGDKFFSNPIRVYALRKDASLLFLGTMAMALFATYKDIQYKRTLPSFQCLAGNANEPVAISCEWTRDLPPEGFMLAMRAHNRTSDLKTCDIEMVDGKNKKVLQKDISVAANGILDIKSTLPNPRDHQTVRLLASCKN